MTSIRWRQPFQRYQQQRVCNVLLVCSLSGAVKSEEPVLGSGGHVHDAVVLDFDEVLTETGESSGDYDGLVQSSPAQGLCAD